MLFKYYWFLGSQRKREKKRSADKETKTLGRRCGMESERDLFFTKRERVIIES